MEASGRISSFNVVGQARPARKEEIMGSTRRVVVILLLFAGVVRADSLTSNQIAQELKQDSVLSLRQNVASVWADNLLAAQAGATYGSPESLGLSIAAVLKAIGIEQSIAGLNYCNLTNC